MKTFKLLFLLIKTFLVSEATVNYEFWIKVIIDQAYIKNDDKLMIFKYRSKVECGALCSIESNCNSWCYGRGETCFLTSIIVSPSYDDEPFYIAPCYTKKRRDIAVGASTYSSPHDSADTKSEITIDGIFLQGYGESFSTCTQQEKSWLLLALRKNATIYEVLIKSSGFLFTCSRINVSVGNILIGDGDFSSYETIKSTTNPCESDKKIMHFKPATPLDGQYVVVQRTTRDASLTIYHIEIDGEFHN